MWDKTNRATPLVRFAALLGMLLATRLVALSQGISSENTAETRRSVLPYRAEASQRVHACSLFSPVLLPLVHEKPITPSQRLHWFITSTVGPAHVVGVAFVSATGTAVNRPGEYGPHWAGFADRFGIGVAGSAVGNAMEASVGRLLQEDPRYFRASQSKLGSRVRQVVGLTFLAPGRGDTVRPA